MVFTHKLGTGKKKSLGFDHWANKTQIKQMWAAKYNKTLSKIPSQVFSSLVNH